MNNLTALHAFVDGHVQGVYFRAFVEEKAIGLGLAGFVRNLTSREAVEVWAEGEKDKIEALLQYMKIGPPASRVDSVTTDWAEYTGNYADFIIKYE